MKKSEIANKGKTKPRGNPAWVKGGPSPNPKGAPKRGTSWAEVITKTYEMTPAQIQEWLGARNELSASFRQMPQDVPLKHLVVARVAAALMFEPTPALLAAIMNRAEGMPTQAVELSGPDKKEITIRAFDYGLAVADIAPRPETDSESSGEGEGHSNGAQVG